MKLTCDLCGGALQMNAGAKDASCKNCGLCYTLEMLRERLQKPAAAPQEPVKPTANEVPVEHKSVEPVQEPVQNPVQEPVQKPVQEPVRKPVVEATPAVEQFVMQVEGVDDDCFVGRVQQGCIGIGEQVYLDGDYSTPFRIYRFNEDEQKATRVSAGESAGLYLVPNRKARAKKPKVITGDLKPQVNAYRCNGTVQDYFEDVLKRNFVGYTVQKQVQWPGLNAPVNFMLLKDAHPMAAIFVFDSSDAKTRYQAQKAVSIFENQIIGCTHFYENYRNEEAYVVSRVRAAMGEKPV